MYSCSYHRHDPCDARNEGATDRGRGLSECDGDGSESRGNHGRTDSRRNALLSYHVHQHHQRDGEDRVGRCAAPLPVFVSTWGGEDEGSRKRESLFSNHRYGVLPQQRYLLLCGMIYNYLVHLEMYRNVVHMDLSPVVRLCQKRKATIRLHIVQFWLTILWVFKQMWMWNCTHVPIRLVSVPLRSLTPTFYSGI